MSWNSYCAIGSQKYVANRNYNAGETCIYRNDVQCLRWYDVLWFHLCKDWVLSVVVQLRGHVCIVNDDTSSV